MPAPIPRAAPVTMATFPLRDMIRCFKIEVVWNELEDLQGRKMIASESSMIYAEI